MSQLRVDIVACEGVGLCAHLAPDLVRVDSWGFPIVTDRPLSRSAERQASAAVRGCPRRALFLAGDEPERARSTRPGDLGAPS